MAGTFRTAQPSAGAPAWPATARPAHDGGGEPSPPDPRHAALWSISGDASAEEGGSAQYTVGFAGYTLEDGETLSIELALIAGAATAEDLAGTLAEALEAALTEGITRSGTALTWDHTAAPSLDLALEIADDGLEEGAESYTLSIGNQNYGSLAAASVVTTIAESGGVPDTFEFDFTGAAMPEGVTLERASAGTYFNDAGVLSSASSNVARFDYRYAGSAWELAGLLAETQATNFARHTMDVATGQGAPANMETALPNTTVAPDGTTSADTIASSAGATNHLYQTSTWPQSNGQFSAGEIMTHACFAKPLAGRYLTMRCGDQGGSEVDVCFDLQTGDMLQSGGTVLGKGCEDVGDGWRRCWISKLATGLGTLFGGGVGVQTSLAASFFCDPVGTETVALWGWDLSVGGVCPSHIPTSNSNVTREADVLTFEVPDGTYELEVVTPSGVFGGTVVATGGTGYHFDWLDLPGSEGQRHIRVLTLSV